MTTKGGAVPPATTEGVTMKMIGNCRLGRDVELRTTTDGTAVVELSGAWNYGRKDADGKQQTMWGSFSMWGKQAEALAPYLLKGKAVFLVVGDVHIETYEGRNGPGHKLVGRVESFEFAGSRSDDAGHSAPAPAPARPPAAARAPAPARAQHAPPPQQAGQDFGDDDIPF